VRAAFHSKTLVNLLKPGLPVAHTLHVPSGTSADLGGCRALSSGGESVVLVAGERYGTGSSRDWAAKGQRLLGIRAVLAASFERIHRSNLIGMGILPLRWPAGTHPDPSAAARRSHRGRARAEALSPRCVVPVRVLRAQWRGRSPAGNGSGRDPARGAAAAQRRRHPDDPEQIDSRGLAAPRRKHMRILVLPSDGIGPEIVAAAMAVLEKTDKAYDWASPTTSTTSASPAWRSTAPRCAKRC
jgi:hypothetical protein